MNRLENHPLVEQIVELFSTGEEAVHYLMEQGLQGQKEFIIQLQQLIITLSKAIDSLLPDITLGNKLPEISKNMLEIADRVYALLEQENLQEATLQFHCGMAPLFIFWKRYVTFFLVYAASEDSLQQWHETEREYFREVRQTPKLKDENEYPYDLSVIVLFYGNKKMTEECLNAIHTYTKNHSYELITFDNGSDPETTAWCNSLSHEKKIHYPYNMGSSVAGNLIFSTASYYAEGKYMMYISNDVIVTPGYDDILFRCVESDPRIAVAVPLCNSASNLQAISVPYERTDMKGMIQFASRYNHLNPHKWYDRSRLFGILGCYRMQALQNLYLAYSPLFCYDMFADDDQSCSFRRMGYRQVLCKDVFVHHYGSATLGAGQFTVMDKGRQQFYQKHGVDAWNSLATAWNMVGTGIQVGKKRSFRVLALEPKFGEGVLAICNQLRENGADEITVDAITYDARYLDDLDGLFNCAVHADQAVETLKNVEYDIAIFGIELEDCVYLKELIKIASQLLNNNSILLVMYKNPYSMLALQKMMAGQEPDNTLYLADKKEHAQIQWLNTQTVHTLFADHGFKVVQQKKVQDLSKKSLVEGYLKTLHMKEYRHALDQLLTISTVLILRK